ncbi:MARVEL domain-containing protein 1-like [Octopus vulgaris]|uniref:MARVEL domain-containing protein 1-like n=1 Tax=Octopus vulgaris TaxID=6645 RepID=A0AA36C2W2_OCTVU|nr:MARVEL domain-containing protein 1-like [Octopus vulgaris]
MLSIRIKSSEINKFVSSSSSRGGGGSSSYSSSGGGGSSSSSSGSSSSSYSSSGGGGGSSSSSSSSSLSVTEFCDSTCHWKPKFFANRAWFLSISSIGPDISYAKSLRGILKLAEIFISILTLICASVAIQYAIAGVGWVQFVAVVTFIIFITFFLLHFLHIFARIPAPMLLIEFAVYVGSCVCIFIAAIVAACYGMDEQVNSC